MQKNERVFHISQILAVHIGMTLMDSNEIRWDNNTKYFWDEKTAFELMLDLVEHVSGKSIIYKEDHRKYHDDVLQSVIPSVRESLIEQMPWLVNVDYDLRSLMGESEEAQRYRHRWVESVTAMAHGEFFKVTEACPRGYRLAHNGFPDLIMN